MPSLLTFWKKGKTIFNDSCLRRNDRGKVKMAITKNYLNFSSKFKSLYSQFIALYIEFMLGVQLARSSLFQFNSVILFAISKVL